MLLKKEIEALGMAQTENEKVFRPDILRLTNAKDRNTFIQLIRSGLIFLHDFLLDQIKELVKIRNPSTKYTADELHKAALAHISIDNLEEYGVWVHYPWSHRLVHLTDEEEFIEIRTSRNQYKITRDEQAVLRQKKIGVIGLSVGQSVAITLIMERICGEIRIADFDRLELTNMNRIRTGIHNLNLPKVYATAREISEIDPFIKVLCFRDGATQENLDAFFMEGGHLDLLIEESDGMDIKVLSRIKARSLGIPVLMEASDRCMVDVERFDLNPELGILHGILDNLDIDTLKGLKSNEDKIPYMLDIAGIETASTRIKASMLEIDQTIKTWPQLASAVVLGGGITADVSRRLLLNQFTDSGRYYVDVEALIGNKASMKSSDEPEVDFVFTDVKGIAESYNCNEMSGQTILKKDEVDDIINAAILAPSGGNFQPWFWVHKNNSLLLFNAVDSNPSFLGFGNFASFIALGASLENAVLRAKQMKYDAVVKLFPDKNHPELAAQISFVNEEKTDPMQLFLAQGIKLRNTNRTLGKREPIEESVLAELRNLINLEQGADLLLFTKKSELIEIADILGELEKLRLLEKTGQRDFAGEIRWTEEENQFKRDGIDINTFDFSHAEIAGLKIAQQKEVMDLIRKWEGGNAFKKLTIKSVDAASAIGILSVSGETLADYLNGGRLLERLWIMSNLKGLSFQPVTSSLFTYARLVKGNGRDLSNDGAEKLNQFRPRFERIFNISSNRAYIMIFRLSIASDPKVKSLRRLKEVSFFSLGKE